jgi:hypothetical protein
MGEHNIMHGVTLLVSVVVVFVVPVYAITGLFPCLLRRFVWPFILEPVGLPPLNISVLRVKGWTFPCVGLLVIWFRLRESSVGSHHDELQTREFNHAFEDIVAQGKLHGILDALIMGADRGIYMVLQFFSEIVPLNENELYRTCRVALNDILGLLVVAILIRVGLRLHRTSWRDWRHGVVEAAFKLCSENVPAIKKKLQEEEEKLKKSLEVSLKSKEHLKIHSLPHFGRSHAILLEELRVIANKENAKWKQGLVSGTVYSGEDKHIELLNAVYSAYSLSNPLHVDVWPSVAQMEAEVCSMTASLVNGENIGIIASEVAGSMTSGGTESIVLAAKAHRECFGRRRGITKPEIICCVTAHAGIDKACELLGIKKVTVPCDAATFKMDWKAVEVCITADTIMVFSSAPSYPQGVIDPIPELSRIALKHKLGLHVDCCLGGFILPFAKRLGYAHIPDFDFTLDGVTSMSCDTHKYGYASKGTSVVLYRNKVRSTSKTFSLLMSGLE